MVSHELLRAWVAVPLDPGNVVLFCSIIALFGSVGAISEGTKGVLCNKCQTELEECDITELNSGLRS